MKPKIVFFDCDGVLITSNTWENLVKLVKFPRKKNDLLWNQYYSGKLSFEKWVDIQSVYFRKNLTRIKYQKEIVEKVEINQDAREIVTYLKNKNIPMVIISSGEIDYVRAVANQLKIKIFKVNTYFRFNSVGRFVRMDFHTDDQIAKVDQVKEICQQFDCLPEETFFVGDSNNDLKAFELTKHGLLYNTKDEQCVKAAWKTIGNLNEIKDIIY